MNGRGFAAREGLRLSDRNLGVEELKKLAFVDSITGASNQIRFYEDAGWLLEQNEYADGGTIVCLDLEKFKYVNDVFGYETGDQVLKKVAEILADELAEKEIFARAYSDHFCLLLCPSDEAKAEERVRRIAARIARENPLRQEYYSLTVCCGICRFQKKERSLNALIDRGNRARQSAKQSQDSILAFYTEEMEQQLEWEKTLEQKMGPALKNGEFVPFIQPRFDLFRQAVVGGEALVRWIEPDGTMYTPDRYVPFFERNGFITELDFAVFCSVCGKLRQWLDEDRPVPPISVNVSRRHLEYPDFVERYGSVIRHYDIPKGLVELELTESVAYFDMKRLKTVLRGLQRYGFVLSLDDFGSEYSSLNILKELPVDIVKLDRMFFGERQSDRERVVIESCVEMCHRLGIMVVCEGVEKQEQVDFLRGIGCRLIQGYWFAKPMPVSEYEKMIFGGADQ